MVKSVYESDLVVPLISSGQPKSDDIEDHYYRNEAYFSETLVALFQNAKTREYDS